MRHFFPSHWRGDRVRTPIRLQFQTTECGVAALTSVLAYYGLDLPLEEVRKATGVSRDCLNAGNLARAARALGLACSVRRCEPDRLCALGAPSIVYLDFIHFAVFEGMRDGDILLNDPSRGRTIMPREQFEESFTGIVLTFAPTTDLQHRRTRPLGSWVRQTIGREGAALIVGAAFCTLAGAGVLVWLADALTRSDLPGPALLAAPVLLFALYALRTEALGALRHRLADSLGKRQIRHLGKQPGAFFAYRIPLSLRDMLDATDRVAETLCTGLLSRWLDLGAIPVLLAGLWWIHPGSALVAALLLILYGLVLAAVFPWLREYDNALKTDIESAFGQLFGDLDEIESWKVGDRDRDLFVRILGLRAKGMSAHQDYVPSEVALTLATRLLPLALMGAGAITGLLAVTGEQIRPEALLPLLLLTASLAGPAARFAGLRGQGLRLHGLLFRMEDLLTGTSELDRAPPPDPPTKERGAASPVLWCAHLTHGHIPDKPPLIDDITLSVAQGEQLGLTGPSGGGKSTLALLLAGLRDPWSGGVGRRVGEAPPIWLDKAPVFFEGSIRHNLCLWREDLEDAALWQALRDACLEEEISTRNGQLDTAMVTRGRNFSGGQLQRLEIARALVHGGSLLILDEALDALNPALEARLRGNLRRRGCTLIVISHRKSTIAACDRVLCIDRGRIVDPDAPKPPPPTASGLADLLLPETETRPTRAVAARGVVEAIQTLTGNRITGPWTTAFDAWGRPDIEALARTADLPCRRVRFLVPTWRKRDHGSLLALSPDGKSARVARPGDLHETSPEDTWRLYPSAASDKPGAWTLIWRGLRDSQADFWRAVALTPPLGGLAFVIPIAPLLVSGDGTGLIAPLLAVLAAVGLLEVSRAIALARLEDSAQSAMLSALVQRLIRVRVPALRQMAREDLADAVFALPRMLDSLRDGWPHAVLDGVLVLVGWGVLAVIAPNLLVPASLCGGVALLGPSLVTHLDRGLFRRFLTDRLRQRRFLTAMMLGQSRLRALDAETRAAGVWEREQDSLLRLDRLVKRSQGLLEATGDAWPWFGLVVARLVSGGAMIGTTSIGITGDAAVGLVLFLTLAACAQFGRAVATYQRIGPHVERLDMLTQLPLEPRIPASPASDSAPSRGDSPGLEARDVRVKYGEKTILDGVTVQIEPGEVVALAGASGSGKSTLLRVLLGYETPEQGRVLMGGRSIEDLDPGTWRRHIGLVQQTDRLEVSVTLRGQLCGTASVGPREVWRVLRDVKLADEVRAMPMGPQTITDDIRLSTGQMQRLLIGRQLIRKPTILVLDEATNAVPDSLQESLIGTFRRLGLTVLLVTHRESALVQSDRVIFLEGGRVAFSGLPTEALGQMAFQSILATECIFAH
ncbi:ATP-binding cassette domain-containing protein [Rhodospirillum sp. A1_3_36]|uniref:ATP-binding cassette domain-containing protein n=1 Tax=Rhodospirillum sp. A1_3_36 TaxID=3391666 RepID=UPI0039A625CD